MQRPLIWLIACVLQAATAAALAEPRLEAWPAWQGQAKPGKSSEVQLTLENYPEGDARITAVTASHEFSRELALQDSQAVRVQLPFVADASGTVTVRVEYTNGEQSEQQIALQLLDPVQPLLVNAVHTPPAAYLANAPAQLLHTAAASLPHQAMGYATVSALVLDSSTLNQLLPAQRLALREFVSACGRLYLVNTSPAQTEELQHYAGCAGQTLAAFTGWQQVEAGRPQTQAWSRYSGNALTRLAMSSAAQPSLVPLCLLLGSYLLGLLLLLHFQARSRLLIGWVVFTTALTLGSWWQRPPQLSSIDWIEMTQGDPVAQTTRILYVAGRGHWRGSIPLAAGISAPVAQAGSALTTSVELQDAGMELSLYTRLFSQRVLTYQLNSIIDPGLELGLKAAKPHLVNQSDSATAAAVLWWNDGFYPVPPLAPGAQWQLQNEAEVTGATPLLQMMHQRLGHASLALLLSRPGPEGDQHWLLLHTPTPEREL